MEDEDDSLPKEQAIEKKMERSKSVVLLLLFVLER